MTRSSHHLRELLLRFGLRSLSATWRFREEIPDDCRRILAGEERAVVAFWHGKMLPVWYRFRGGAHAALVSASRDGELLADYLHNGLKYEEVIRGSSSRGGSEALAALVNALARRSSLITPDGPRGPACEAKAGALVAALRSGCPILLVGWSCSRRIRLGSWDRMEIPYPFSAINFRYCKFELKPDRREIPDSRDKKNERDGANTKNEANAKDGTNKRVEATERNEADESNQKRIDPETLHRFTHALNALNTERS